MTSRLFVGNIPFSATEDQLRSVFATAGEVLDVSVPTDRLAGQPRGFAFVEMASSEEALAAVAQLDGFELDGRSIRVGAAEERGSRSSPDRTSRFGADLPPHRTRPKGSRRNVRGRRRGF